MAGCLMTPAGAADTCDPDAAESVRVVAVNADWSVALADRRAVRLAGVDPVEATPRHPALGAEGRARLASWLVGRTAGLRLLGAGVDRWGRVDGLLFAAAEPAGVPGSPAPPLPVGVAMVDAGLARARPGEAVPAGCWASALAAERTARAARTGLWDDPAYAILRPGDAGGLAAALGTMVLVEGRIARVSVGRSRLFIKLRDTGPDVTVSLAKRDLFILDQLGLKGARLAGTSVRVRGDLEQRSGFSIDIVDPAQIEVLDPPPPGEAGCGRDACRDRWHGGIAQ